MVDIAKNEALENLLKQIELCFIADSIIVEIPLYDPEIEVVELTRSFYEILHKISSMDKTYYEKRLTDIEYYWGYTKKKPKGIRGISG
ncbi:hypothetical protein J4455_02825 [Candidatus Woesearchaeota archaeon]|nr:hypothetical protein [Candidatus Woesearchaeota archaeon]